LPSLILREFYGTGTIRFDSRKVTHVKTEAKRVWHYEDLPDEVSSPAKPAPKLLSLKASSLTFRRRTDALHRS